MTNLKFTLLGFITGVLIVIGANSFDVVVKVMVMPTLTAMEVE